MDEGGSERRHQTVVRTTSLKDQTEIRKSFKIGLYEQTNLDYMNRRTRSVVSKTANVVSRD